MGKCTITPLKVGEFHGIEHSNLTYLMSAGTKLVAPIIMYLVQSNDRMVLVDTGPSDEEWAKKYHHGLTQTEEMKPVNALKNIGVDAKDIEFIVNTHLHWDHCFNNKLFPNAKIFVQKREMEFAISPLPPHWVFYESHQLGMTPPWLSALDRIVAVEGDYKLFPGLTLVTIPGHTPGMQGLLVEDTDHGRTLIASDCCGLFENWTGRGVYKHIPSGIHYSLPEYYETFKKMEMLCDFVLPGHDATVFDKKVY